MKHLCILDQFSVDFRYSLQENLYMPLYIFAKPTATQGLQMADPMSICCSCSVQRVSMCINQLHSTGRKQINNNNNNDNDNNTNN
jgi:hypothetical protein